MSFIFNGLSATVTISGTVTANSQYVSYDIPTGATRIQKCQMKSIAGAGGYDVYTVTAGTDLYIKTLIVDGGSTPHALKISDNGTDAIADGTVYDDAIQLYADSDSKSHIIHFDVPFKVTTKLRCYDASAGATNIVISFVGWEI